MNSWLLVNVDRNEDLGLRCGWTIPRQVGPAVVRNRLRRWGREFLRKWLKREKKSLDVNFVFKRKEQGFYRALDHKEFDEAFEKMLGKIERHLK